MLGFTLKPLTNITFQPDSYYKRRKGINEATYDIKDNVLFRRHRSGTNHNRPEQHQVLGRPAFRCNQEKISINTSSENMKGRESGIRLIHEIGQLENQSGKIVPSDFGPRDIGGKKNEGRKAQKACHNRTTQHSTIVLAILNKKVQEHK